MADLCRWLHEKLQELSILRFPFDTAQLPVNGIYFFYGDGGDVGSLGTTTPDRADGFGVQAVPLRGRHDRKADRESGQRYQLILIEVVDETGLIEIFDNARIYK
jgi:hypothetical protein